VTGLTITPELNGHPLICWRSFLMLSTAINSFTRPESRGPSPHDSIDSMTRLCLFRIQANLSALASKSLTMGRKGPTIKRW